MSDRDPIEAAVDGIVDEFHDQMIDHCVDLSGALLDALRHNTRGHVAAVAPTDAERRVLAAGREWVDADQAHREALHRVGPEKTLASLNEAADRKRQATRDLRAALRADREGGGE